MARLASVYWMQVEDAVQEGDNGVPRCRVLRADSSRQRLKFWMLNDVLQEPVHGYGLDGK